MANLNYTIQTFTSEGVWTFDRDGTGSPITETNRSVTLPYSVPIANGPLVNPPSAGAHTVSFNFHWHNLPDDMIFIEADPGTYVIDWIYGPLAALPHTTYHLDGFSRTGSITPDGKTIIPNGLIRAFGTSSLLLSMN
jgi:hypothetical protein